MEDGFDDLFDAALALLRHLDGDDEEAGEKDADWTDAILKSRWSELS